MPGTSAKLNGKKGGRPKGSVGTHTLDASEMRKRIIETVNQNLQPLMEAKMDLALGHNFAHMDEKGNLVKVYKKSPDSNSIQYLLNQSVGKPKETMEIQSEVILKLDM